MGPSTSRPVAAVDVGTNTVRLLVLDARGAPVLREERVTRLGAGVDRRGRLDDAAVARTLAVLDEYARRWRAAGVDDTAVRIGATSAVRDAADRDRFLEGVRARTGVAAEVVDGDTEARASFAGATAGRDLGSGDVLVVDIGGGSTELVVGRRGRVRVARSLQLGSVRLTERLLVDDPPTPAQVAAATDEVRARLSEADAVLAGLGGPSGGTSVVAVAGTATTLACMAAGITAWRDGYVDGAVLSRATVAGLCARLLALPAARRHEVGLLAPGREDVIAGGALVLREVLSAARADRVVVSERDVLDGLAATLR